MLGAALALTLGCGACAGLKPLLTQRLRWIPAVGPLADLDDQWRQTHETIADGLRIKAMNSGRDLHLLLETDEPGLQQQFCGQFGQSLLILFQAKNSTHGLRVDFKSKASFSLLADPIDTVDRCVSLLGPAREGYPRLWSEGTEGVELTAVMSSGALVYELRVPLEPHTPGGFSLEAKPGDKLTISIVAAPLASRSAAQAVESGSALSDAFGASTPYVVSGFDAGGSGDFSAAPDGSTFLQWPVQLAQNPVPR